jgi:Chemotaxis response regulator containing a CheY-like receiver domain and a methylesterase domain
MRTLIVDDSTFMRSIIKKIITEYSCEVVGEASDGIDVLNKYKELQPDIVFLDITMPKKNGMEALKEIINYDKNAKVVMCSSMGQKFFVIEALQIGAFDFIVKPFEKDRIFEVINRIKSGE